MLKGYLEHVFALGMSYSKSLAIPTALRSVLANSGWLLLDRVLRILLSITIGAWVARHLGPSNYGQLAYVLALLALFQAACTLGLDGPVVRDISQDRSQAPMILGSAFRLRLASGVAGWLATIGFVALLRPGDWLALLMVSIVGASLVFQAAEVVDLWLQSQSSSRISIPFRFVAYCIVALSKVGLILANAPLWTFAAAALADVVLVGAALAYAYTRLPLQSTWAWDPSTAKRICIESWPLMLSALSVGIYMRIDQVMLRQLSGERELGLYSAVLPFSQGWHIIPMTLYASLLPKLAELKSRDPAQYQRRLQQIFTLFAWAGVVAAALTALFSSLLVSRLLGPRYADATPILRWHVITNIFVFLGVAQSLAVVSERTPKLALSKTLIGACVCLVANYFLIPRWGAVGAAGAAILAQFSSVVLSNLALARPAFRMQLKAFFLLPRSH